MAVVASLIANLSDIHLQRLHPGTVQTVEAMQA
jgi:hypothetical protein